MKCLFSATNVNLDNRGIYPNFLRVIASDGAQSKVIARILQNMTVCVFVYILF